jgi:hypothetical protein
MLFLTSDTEVVVVLTCKLPDEVPGTPENTHPVLDGLVEVNIIVKSAFVFNTAGNEI